MENVKNEDTVARKNNRFFILFFSLFFSLFGPSLHAQAAYNQGFNTPGVGFGSNPFGGKGGSADEEEDTDMDEEDLSQEMLRNRMDQKLRESVETPPATQPPDSEVRSKLTTERESGGVDFGEVGQQLGATSVQAGAKIIPGGKTNCLKLDPYTGIGPDVISNFDFPDADIVEIAKTLGRLTCLNFILDKDVRGRVSIVSNAPITVGDAWKAFLTALDVNNFALIPSGKYLRIARQRDAKDKQIKLYTSGVITPDNDMLVTKVLSLKYLTPEDVLRVFRNFQGAIGRMIPYEQTNTVIITDTGANVKKIVDMIEMLDVESFDEALEVIHIKYAAAQDISRLIDQLLPGGGGASNAPGVSSNVPRFRSGFAARKTKEGGMISHIIPDDRTNSVIVSANGKGLEQVKELIHKLDSKISATLGGSKIHVIYLQFADAEQVAQTLNNLTSGNTTKSTTPPPLAGTTTSASTTAQLFEGAIKIAADKATNALVITGTPTDFETISRVIAKLDVPRDQVFVEAVIMEMQLDKSFSFGTAIANPTNGIGFFPGQPDLAGSLQNPLGLSGLALGFKGGNQTNLNITSPSGTPISIPVYSVMGVVNALQKNGAANVLSTPQILTLDNQEATIEVANTIPLPQTSVLPNTSIQQQSFTREKLGLTLKIKPQINKISDFVKLEIDQKLASIDTSTPVASAVAPFTVNTKERSAKSTVVVQDGDTVVIGGLMRDEVADQVTKVPLLGDIPILGWLFKSKTSKTTKINLLALITPKIIKQYPNMRKILDTKVRDRDEFIEKNAGGDDPYQDYKLKMIKELPPVSALKQGGRVESAAITPTDESQTAQEPSARVASPQQSVILVPPKVKQ